MKRIGIYSGTFNPVHAGHISFALQAIEAAHLDKVYLMPERHNQLKKDVAHYGHRVAMVRQAIKPHRQLDLIETTDISFTVDKTLPKLKRQFNNSRLVFLIGSDTLKYMPKWPNIERLLSSSELVVGVRANDEAVVSGLIDDLPVKPSKLVVIDSYAASVSSSKIREALRKSQEAEGILTSVRHYSNKNWLYISLA